MNKSLSIFLYPPSVISLNILSKCRFKYAISSGSNLSIIYWALSFDAILLTLVKALWYCKNSSCEPFNSLLIISFIVCAG